MIEPWNDIDPSAANVIFSGRLAWKLLCVNNRWKPTLTPQPTTKYSTTARSADHSATPVSPTRVRTKQSVRNGPATITIVRACWNHRYHLGLAALRKLSVVPDPCTIPGTG